MILTFTKPESDSPFDRLPAELTTQILEYAFAGRTRYAGNCRLVCQSLYNMSSPYLLSTVVVAERMDALRKLRKVMDHSYFSRHVTIMIWDASYYDKSCATDYAVYCRALEDADHLDSSRDTDDPLDPQSDMMLLTELQKPKPAVTSTHNHDLLEYTLDSEDLSDMNGCHYGFVDYYRGWKNQHLIRGDGTFPKSRIGNDLGREYFLEAVKKLPNLCHLSYSDYRALAYDDQSYTKLCQRLFGETVCPYWSLENHDAPQRFQCFLQDLAVCDRSWDFLSIGRHPFEFHYHDSMNYHTSYYDVPSQVGHEMVRVPYKTLFVKPSDRQRFEPITLTVRSLRLPALEGDNELIPDDDALSRIVTVGLVELDIRARDFDDRYRYVKDAELLDEEDLSEDDEEFHPGHKVFDRLLLCPSKRREWESVQSLTIRGFVLDTDCLRRLLLHQVPALRKLRIIDCHCTQKYDDALKDIKEKISPFINLTGVEIFGLRFPELPDENEDHRFAQEYQREMCVRQEVDYEAYMEDGEPFVGLFISDWPYERFELEAAMLGGRVNAAVRTVEGFQDDEDRREWKDTPRSGFLTTFASQGGLRVY